jgi:hypothetical protein
MFGKPVKGMTFFRDMQLLSAPKLNLQLLKLVFRPLNTFVLKEIRPFRITYIFMRICFRDSSTGTAFRLGVNI